MQCGLVVEIEKKIDLVRGKAEFDVYAEETVSGRKHTIACECKYWNTAIPQDVIFGFRTKVNDIGANFGLIISSSKFQSGAIAAVDRTNVSLLTWDEFQDRYFDTWYCKHFYLQLQDGINIDFEYF